MNKSDILQLVQFLKVEVDIGVVVEVVEAIVGVVVVEGVVEAVGEGVALSLTSVLSPLSVFKFWPAPLLFRELLLFNSAAAAVKL